MCLLLAAFLCRSVPQISVPIEDPPCLRIDLNMYIYAVCCRTTFYSLINCLSFDGADIFRCRVRNNTFYNVSYHCKRNSDRRNNFCIVRD